MSSDLPESQEVYGLSVETTKSKFHPARDLRSLAIDEEIAQLYFVRRWTQARIGDYFGITADAVSKRIKNMKKEWRNSKLENADIFVKQELLKLAKLEEEAWDAWYRSIGKSVSTKTIKGEDDSVSSTIITENELVGDPRFLQRLENISSIRAKLLGLNAPDRIEVSNTLEGKLIGLIQSKKVTYTMLASDVGDEVAKRYFNMAGMPIPVTIDVIPEDEEDDELYDE